MIRHYITIASRNFIKYKLQTLISVIGLAIGLVCFTYGMKWLEYETSYDGFYPKSEQMYQQTNRKKRAEITTRPGPQTQTRFSRNKRNGTGIREFRFYLRI